MVKLPSPALIPPTRLPKCQNDDRPSARRKCQNSMLQKNRKFQKFQKINFCQKVKTQNLPFSTPKNRHSRPRVRPGPGRVCPNPPPKLVKIKPGPPFGPYTTQNHPKTGLKWVILGSFSTHPQTTPKWVRFDPFWVKSDPPEGRFFDPL